MKFIRHCRSLSDDEASAIEHQNSAHVMFSTPVSSLKSSRSSIIKPKSTRFRLPCSDEKIRNKSIDCAARYINVSHFLNYYFHWPHHFIR